MALGSRARTFAIGDIHGCDRALMTLLDALELTPNDQLITLGDYIDRGSGSRQVIDRLMKLDEECEFIPLMGNHEIMMLTALDDESQLRFWLGSGGKQTIASYGDSIDDILPAHIEFLKNCRPYYEADEFFCVHANYTPKVALNVQPEYTMYWEHLDAYFPEPHVSGKTAIVGHTPQRNGQVLQTEHLICLDTFCYGGGVLTALDLTSGDLWQSTPNGELVQVNERPAG